MSLPTVFPPPTHAQSPDGTELLVTTFGQGPETLLFIPPASAPPIVFRHAIRYLGARYRAISWASRGMYGGTPATEFGRSAQEEDALFCLDSSGVSRAHIVAWSTGAQLALRLAHKHPHRVRSLVLVCPTFGEAYAVSLGIPPSGILRRLQVASRGLFPALSTVRRRVGIWPETGTYLKRLGLAADTLDDELFREAQDAFRRSQPNAYLKTMQALEEESQAPRLEELSCPTLVVVGERDRFGGVVGPKLVARRLPQGELFVVKSATHYALLELPELINLRVEKFLTQQKSSRGAAA